MILVVTACGLFGSLVGWFVVGLIAVGFSLCGVLGLFVNWLYSLAVYLVAC